MEPGVREFRVGSRAAGSAAGAPVLSIHEWWPSLDAHEGSRTLPIPNPSTFMNDPTDSPFVPNGPADATNSVSASLHAMIGQMEDLIRRHPMAAVLASLGVGCTVGLAARELLSPPPTPKQRALNLLEDIQERLAAFAEPVAEQASHLAEETADAMQRGLHSTVESSLGQRLRSLFS